VTYYGVKHLADALRTVRKNTITIAPDIPEDKDNLQSRAKHAHGFRAPVVADVKDAARLQRIAARLDLIVAVTEQLRGRVGEARRTDSREPSRVGCGARPEVPQGQR
jgi:hypothetical protein